MKKIITSCFIFILIMITVGCSSTNQQQLSDHAIFEEYELVLKDAIIENQDDGTKIIKVNAEYINNGKEPQYAYSSFSVKAFQNEIELEDISDINGAQKSLIQEVKNESKIYVTYIFRLNDESPVDVLINEPTAKETTIGTKTFLDSD